MDAFINEINNLVRNNSISTQDLLIQEQVNHLTAFLMEYTQIKSVADIRFNTGIASAIILNSRPDIHVHSFDNLSQDYVIKQKKNIDSLFSNRHTLILGDTIRTKEVDKDEMFDFIFIDGNTKIQITAFEIINAYKLLKKGYVMCIDDYNKKHGNPAVLASVEELLKENKVEVVDFFEIYDRTLIYLRKL
jgi:predicted O-methyltransferase YrrM